MNLLKSLEHLESNKFLFVQEEFIHERKAK